MAVSRFKYSPRVRRLCAWTKQDAFPLCPLSNSVYSVAKMSNLRLGRASGGDVAIPDKPYKVECPRLSLAILRRRISIVP